MDDTTLEESNSLSILGIEFNRKFCWKDHIKLIAKRASQRVSVLRHMRLYLSDEQIIHLYKPQVRPVMEYNSFVWGGASSSYLKM